MSVPGDAELAALVETLATRLIARDARIATAERHGLVEETASEADVVVLGMRENRHDAHLATRACDAHRDLAAIGDNEFFDTHSS